MDPDSEMESELPTQGETSSDYETTEPKFSVDLRHLQTMKATLNEKPNFVDAKDLLDRAEGRELFGEKLEDYSSAGAKLYCSSNNSLIPFLGHFSLIIQFIDESEAPVGIPILIHLKQDQSAEIVTIFVKDSGVTWNPGWSSSVTTVHFDFPVASTCKWFHDEVCGFPLTKPESWEYNAWSWNCQNAADELCKHLFQVGAPGWSLTNTFEGCNMCGRSTFWTICYFMFFFSFGALMVLILPSVRLAQPPNTTVLCEVDSFSSCTAGIRHCLPNMTGCYLDVKFTDPYTNISYSTRAPVNSDTTDGNCEPLYFPWSWFSKVACCGIDQNVAARGFSDTDPYVYCDMDPQNPGNITFFPLQYSWRFSNFYLDIADNLNTNRLFIISVFAGTVIFFWGFFVAKFYRFIRSKCPPGCCQQDYVEMDWVTEAASSTTRGVWQLCGLACLCMVSVQLIIIRYVPHSSATYAYVGGGLFLGVALISAILLRSLNCGNCSKETWTVGNLILYLLEFSVSMTCFITYLFNLTGSINLSTAILGYGAWNLCFALLFEQQLFSIFFNGISGWSEDFAMLQNLIQAILTSLYQFGTTVFVWIILEIAHNSHQMTLFGWILSISMLFYHVILTVYFTYKGYHIAKSHAPDNPEDVGVSHYAVTFRLVMLIYAPIVMPFVLVAGILALFVGCCCCCCCSDLFNPAPQNAEEAALLAEIAKEDGTPVPVVPEVDPNHFSPRRFCWTIFGFLILCAIIVGAITCTFMFMLSFSPVETTCNVTYAYTRPRCQEESGIGWWCQRVFWEVQLNNPPSSFPNNFNATPKARSPLLIFKGADTAQEVLNQHPVDSSAPCYYDPNDPSSVEWVDQPFLAQKHVYLISICVLWISVLPLLIPTCNSLGMVDGKFSATGLLVFFILVLGGFSLYIFKDSRLPGSPLITTNCTVTSRSLSTGACQGASGDWAECGTPYWQVLVQEVATSFMYQEARNTTIKGQIDYDIVTANRHLNEYQVGQMYPCQYYQEGPNDVRWAGPPAWSPMAVTVFNLSAALVAFCCLYAVLFVLRWCKNQIPEDENEEQIRDLEKRIQEIKDQIAALEAET